ncbi:hypothetical protein GP486_004271 [Trichoglossum hirsutum]|uniref:Uncharacterized protein n=1 Tax=Trichoglossum hirsutum TaxID=265104 RepID=A0A9P8RPE5_9PEZI|nr:hypothetical protein GP486_004271 [Trichoglossum hirsutum]
MIWRESCTDQSWKATECLKLCIDGVRGQNDVLVTFCPSEEVCCDYPNPSCCAQGKGYWIINGEVSTTRPASSGSTAGAQGTHSSHRPPALVLALAIALPILFSTLLALIIITFFRGYVSRNIFPLLKRVSGPLPSPPLETQQQQPSDQQSLQGEPNEIAGLNRIEMSQGLATPEADGAETAEADGAEMAEIAEGGIAELQELHGVGRTPE